MLHKKTNEINGDTTVSDQSSLPKDSASIYRWNYQDQLTYDTNIQKKKRKKGAFAYALVMALVFLLCFAILVTTLIWYRHSPSYGRFTSDVLSTSDVSDLLKPATVLIYAQASTSYGYGTGFLIGSDGYIATNYHILRDATACSVTLYTGEELEAEIVGYSEPDDLAVLKIEGIEYPTVTIGDSDLLREGDTAIAIGHPSGIDAAWSTTQGVISALNRTITVAEDSYIAEMTMIQTDAALNPGNSGGPLCNDRGEVIGIVTRKLNDNEGISFAIPINGAMEILNAILQNGNANDIQSSITKVRPKIGITAGTIKTGGTYSYQGKQYTAERDGVLVSSVDPEGIAANRLRVRDIIIAFNGISVADMDAFTELLYQQKLGSSATVIVWRDGKEVTVSLYFK